MLTDERRSARHPGSASMQLHGTERRVRRKHPPYSSLTPSTDLRSLTFEHRPRESFLRRLCPGLP
eukprot:scaffold52475_cov48-Phaeocystis_antarctica.AAC.2